MSQRFDRRSRAIKPTATSTPKSAIAVGKRKSPVFAISTAPNTQSGPKISRTRNTSARNDRFESLESLILVWKVSISNGHSRASCSRSRSRGKRPSRSSRACALASGGMESSAPRKSKPRARTAPTHTDRNREHSEQRPTERPARSHRNGCHRTEGHRWPRPLDETERSLLYACPRSGLEAPLSEGVPKKWLLARSQSSALRVQPQRTRMTRGSP